MRKFTIRQLVLTAILGIASTLMVSCDREPSEDAMTAGFPATGDVFLDGFTGGLEYLPFGGSRLDAFKVDEEVFFSGTSSMRFDVPNVGDPQGAFAGAIFRSGQRDLSGFDALTFYAKASRAGTINEIGFGQDFGDNQYQTTINGLRVSTGWEKYTIPIPDPSKLTAESGLFWYAEGAEDNDGYTFWIDELQFEKLGTVAQPRPAIFGGVDRVEQTFIGGVFQVTGTQTFNLENGTNQTVAAAPAYFNFRSSNEDVATVNALGEVNIIAAGEAVISATIGGVRAAGSLTVQSVGEFVRAPIPTQDPANVISIFSDAYTNVPVDFYNGFFAPFQTTLGGANLRIGGDNIISYTELNFVASEFKNPTVNASEMTHLHVDIQVQSPVNPGDFVVIELGDFGADGAFGGGNDNSDRVTIGENQLRQGEWVSIDIPLSDFNDLPSRNNLAQWFFITEGTNPNAAGTITEILVDNMYFYR
ncbi:MAG: hypothetical protein AAFO69_02660 [Bacteroidota bacterium]